MLARALATLAASVVLGAAPAYGNTLKRPARPPLPNPMPQIVTGGCPGAEDEVSECYIPPGVADNTGTVWARGAVFSYDHDSFTIMHGLGHAYDRTMMDDGERHAFERAIGRLDEEWSFTFTTTTGVLLQSPASLAEAFADAYANCRLGHVVAPGHAWEAGYDYYPTGREHLRACGVITRAGADRAP